MISWGLALAGILVCRSTPATSTTSSLLLRENARSAAFLEAWSTSPVLSHLPPPAEAAANLDHRVITPAGTGEEGAGFDEVDGWTTPEEDIMAQNGGTSGADNAQNPPEDDMFTVDAMAEVERQLDLTEPASTSPFSLDEFFADAATTIRRVAKRHPHGRELREALTRIRAAHGQQDVDEIARLEGRVEGRMQVLRYELEQAGGPQEGSFFIRQPARYFIAPTHAILLWPPVYAVKDREAHRFGNMNSLSEKIMRRTGELDIPDELFAYTKQSFAAFDGEWTGRDPYVNHQTADQWRATDHFYAWYLRHVSSHSRLYLINGRTVFDQLLLPLLGSDDVKVETIEINCEQSRVTASVTLYFIRARGSAIETSKPAAQDMICVLLRTLAHGGDSFPPFSPFSTWGRTSAYAHGEVRDVPDAPAATDLAQSWFARLGHLARIKRDLPSPVSLDLLRMVDHELHHIVDTILQQERARALEGLPVARADAYIREKGRRTQQNNMQARSELQRGNAISQEAADALARSDARSAAYAALPQEVKQKRTDDRKRMTEEMNNEEYEKFLAKVSENKKRMRTDAPDILRKRSTKFQEKKLSKFVLLPAITVDQQPSADRPATHDPGKYLGGSRNPPGRPRRLQHR
ncbi:hypothetical protein JCM10213_001926 [Rhodosporidiobolus nylandii]